MGERAVDDRVKVLGWIHVVLGGACLAIGLFVCARLAQDPSGRVLYYVGPIFLFLSALYFLPSVIAGWALITGKRWGVFAMALLSVLMLFAIPVGTGLGIFGLWALFTGKPPAPPPKPVVEPAAQRAENRRVLGVLVMAGLVGCGFVVFLGVGFMVSGDTAPAGLTELTVPAAIAFAALLTFLLVKRPFAEFPEVPRENPLAVFARGRRINSETKAQGGAYDARLARLDADPVRRSYAARMRMGEWWSDEHIAYDLDRARLDTCSHLQPVERALRDARLTVKPVTTGAVACDCRVDEAGFIERFAPPPFVTYREFFRGDRAATDFPIAQIVCDRDNSVIEVVHGLEARPGTPWFPAPPRPSAGG